MTSGRYPAKAFALVAVVIMLLSVTPIALIVVGGDDVSAENGSKTVTYHDLSTGVSVPITYYGTAVAEYNPEYWDGYFVGKVGDHEDGYWKGPLTTISHELTIEWDGGWIRTGAERITIQLPDYTKSWTMNQINGGRLVSNSSQSITIEKDSYSDWGVNYYYSGSLTISITFEINKVFGGWIDSIGNPVNPGDVLLVDSLYVNWITPDLHVYDDLRNATSMFEKEANQDKIN